MRFFGWLCRLLTRLLSPDVLKLEMLRGSPGSPAPAAAPAPVPLPPPPQHRDPKTDTAVIMIEGVRKEAQKAMGEAKDTCESVRRTQALR